jgi:hypothetical protein
MLHELEPDEFENLTLDLLSHLGLKNAVWRTPGRDGGRDIQGDIFTDDFSGHTSRQSWYVECKRYAGTVSWPVVWEKIAYAESNSADVLLMATTSTLSPQAIDEVNRWNEKRKTPSIRIWGGHDLRQRLALFPDILVKYELSPQPIRDAAISLLALSKILLKYSNAIEAHIEFGSPPDKHIVAIQALSELMSTRIEEIEQHGRLQTVPFRSAIDAYDWLVGVDHIERAKLDRFASRAILSLVHASSPAPMIEILVDTQGRPALRVEACPQALLSDLATVAFWGGMRFMQVDQLIVLEN